MTVSTRSREWTGYVWDGDTLWPATIYWDYVSFPDVGNQDHIIVRDMSTNDLHDEIESQEDMRDWKFYYDISDFKTDKEVSLEEVMSYISAGV